MPTSELRQAYFDILMERVGSFRYASPMMMDRLEKACPDRESAEEYVRTLIDAVSKERYPSPQLLERISNLIKVLERDG